jgi:hypothetical protein
MKKNVLLLLMAICLVGTNAWGALSGSYANGSGMIALNALAGNPFVWSVDYVGGNWVYTYSFTPSGANRGVAFIDLEVGGQPPSGALSYTFSYANDPTGVAGLTGTVPVTTLLDQVIDVRPNPNVISNAPLEPVGIKQYQSFTDKTNITGTDISVSTVMSGIQWFLPSWPYTSDTTLSWYGKAARQAGMFVGFNSGWTLTLTTSALPMWGKFYLDGGDWTTNNGWLLARNSQYDNAVRPPFDTSSAFSTQQIQSGWIPVPNYPPAVLSTNPASGATSVALNSTINVTFSKDMDVTTINNTTISVSNVTGVSGTVTYNASNMTATFTPTNSLSPGTTYTVTVSSGVKDLTGITMSSPVTWTFTTAASVDSTPPSVLSTTPGNGAGAVAINSPISATFSKAIVPSSVIFTVNGVAGAVTYNSGTYTATFTPSTLLANSTTYTATINAGVTDLAGNASTSSTVWTFTTAPAPTVLSTAPSDGATNVSVSNPITVTFSTAMDATTVTSSTFTIQGVTGTVSYNSLTQSAIFTPSSVLSNNSTYSASIGTGVKDLTGAALTAPYSWSFTTTANADTTPPTVVSTSPANGSAGIDINSPITVTFSEAMDPTTIDNTTFTVNGVSGTVTYNPATTSVTFMPSAQLSSGTAYTATISGSVKDVAGNAMTTPASWTFTTAAASLFSGLISDITIDNDGNLGYTSNAWSPDSPGNPTGVRLSWEINQVGDAWQYKYTMYGNATATDKAVTNIDIATPSGFSAADLLPGWTVTRPDTGDITANVTVSPSASTLTEVSSPTLQKSIYGIQWHFTQDYIVENQPALMFVLTFTTNRAPMWGDVLIYSDVIAGTGFPLAWDSQFGQTTSAPISTGNNGGWVLVPGNVPTPPTVLATTPADGATGFAVGSILSATFSQDIDPATVNGTTFMVNGLSGTVQYNAANRIATFAPVAALSYATQYTATITSGIKGLTGVAMSANKTWSFTTAAPPDTTPPTVLSVTPVNGSQYVGLTGPLSAVFSKSINPATINATTFTLRDAGGNQINGSVTYNAAANTATFTPGSQLSYYLSYTATLTSGIKDASGNALASNESWTFTTQPLYGDLVGSGGALTINDALLALQITTGLVTPTSYQLAACDVAPLVNGEPHPDGKCDGGDVIVILRNVVGLDNW